VKRDNKVIGLDDVPFIPLYSPIPLIYYWPWTKNYYGLIDESAWGTNHMDAHIWIDQDLKAEMGFK